MNTAPSIQLYLFFARDNDKAVILRQGPSKVSRLILWHRDSDRFEDGQWLKHKVYPDRCDLSPDGQHFLFFALDGKWQTETKGSYTAISKPPYFTALTLIPQGDTWGGGGRFLDNHHYIIDANTETALFDEAKDIHRVYKGAPGKGCTTGLRLANNTPAPLNPDIRNQLLGRTKPDRDTALDHYETRLGCLYRLTGTGEKLIRDFSDMAFEPIRAPYDTHPSDVQSVNASTWHPLDGETS